LSKGGRITSIKSSLYNLPIFFFFSFFPLPVLLIALRNFNEISCEAKLVKDEFKFYLVSWSKICTLIFSNNLGVRNLLLFNQALPGSGYGVIPQKERFCGDWL